MIARTFFVAYLGRSRLLVLAIDFPAIDLSIIGVAGR
jgi:hypothetical protein